MHNVNCLFLFFFALCFSVFLYLFIVMSCLLPFCVYFVYDFYTIIIITGHFGDDCFQATDRTCVHIQMKITNSLDNIQKKN